MVHLHILRDLYHDPNSIMRIAHISFIELAERIGI